MVATETEKPPTSTGPPRRRSTANPLQRLWRNYVVRRVLRAVFAVWVVATGVFFMVRLLPGNPVDTYIAKQTMKGIPYEEAAASASSLYSFDPNSSLIQQYLEYMLGVVRLDFGVTLSQTPVTDKIASHLPWTLFSVGLALVFSVVIGLLLGMAMAYRRGGILDHAASAIGSTFHAVPNYLWAIIIVTVPGTQLGWFDFAEMRGVITTGVAPGFNAIFLGDALYHALLPISAYFLTTVGTWALVMKASTVQALGEDYVMVARARGLSGARIGTMYVGRNAVLPLVAQIATQAGFVVGGAIFVEMIFQYDGVGKALFDAVSDRDYGLIQGILLIVTIAVIFANLIADLTYGLLDPRIRTSGNQEDS